MMMHGGPGGGGWGVYIWGDDEARKKKHVVTWPLLKRVLGYARPYTWHIVALLISILITTALGLLTPLIFRDLIDNALTNGDAIRLNWLALGLVAIPVISGLVRVLQRRWNASIGEGVILDLRVALFQHIQRMSIRFFTNTKTGELMSRLNNDVVGAQRAISNTLIDIITNLITVVATLAVMIGLEWRLTVLGILVLPFFILVARRVGGSLRKIARQQMDANAQMNALMNETLNIGGAMLVKLFGRERDEVSRFGQRAGKVAELGIRQAVFGSRFFVVIGMVSVIGTALVYWVGGHLVLQGAFTVGTIVAFGSFLTQLYGPLQALTNAPVEFATSMVSFERVFEVVDLPLEIQEKPKARVLKDAQGALRFEHVSFTYALNDAYLLSDVERVGQMGRVKRALSGGDALTLNPSPSGRGTSDAQQTTPAHPNIASVVKTSDAKLRVLNDHIAGNDLPPFAMREKGLGDEGSVQPQSQARELALTDLDFSVQPGQLVALVGPSGAGKTTLTYLIPRLYDPSDGRILLDGHDLRDVTLDSLAGQIGMVTQETHLFHDSIRTNLLYAKPDATQVELEAACRAANIHDFIAELPEGYDTVVGERGYRLSGGEKQRLALARVILKNPRILVLDEATSHLDSQSEALIQDALKTVMQGRSSIVIAHRLSTILAADLILVLDRGQIVERGTHDELLAQAGLYAHLYETQFNREREAV